MTTPRILQLLDPAHPNLNHAVQEGKKTGTQRQSAYSKNRGEPRMEWNPGAVSVYAD
jgi:hypothetical protein